MFDIKIYPSVFDEQSFKQLNNKIDTIMANLQDLQGKEAELQASVDATQAKIEEILDGNKGTIADLESHIAALQALVDAAPTPDQIQSVVDSLEATKEDLESTVADAEVTTTTTTEAPVDPSVGG